MASEVSSWLERLGLGQYAAGFSEHDIDWALLPRLDHDTLKEIGVRSAGHRLRILEAVAALNAEPAPASRPDAATQAERRQLTVMFCDLVGSTGLSGRLDPEVLREVVRAYQRAVEGVTQRFGGHVAQYLGDGLLVYFGYPMAHEDDAQRAVHAALGIPAALAQINRQLAVDHDVQLVARVGIHTGPVVVGEMGSRAHSELLAMGETPNVAARLQSLAAPGATVISGRTRQLVGQLFALEPLPETTLKGVATPMQAFVVTGERHVETRFASNRTGDATAMVGRRSELALLLDRWHQAKAGNGQVVMLTGEAGIGKSCIVSALAEALLPEEHLRVSYQCSPFHTGTAFYPVIRHLGFAAGIAASDPPEAQLDRLEQLLRQWQGTRPVSVPLLGALLGLGKAAEARHGMLNLSPEQRRERTLQSVFDLLTGAAETRPVLVVLEDAHWIDPTTLKLLELARDRIEEHRLMLVVTARPTFDGAFGGHPAVSHLSLNRLGRESIFQIIERVCHGKTLPPGLMREIAAKTDGVPLFVEELTKTLLESGQLRDTGQAYEFDGQIDRLTIPSSLRDTLMARLDRAHQIKEVAQTAACIGREFSWPLLAAVSPLTPERLDEALEQLVDAELVFRRGVPPQATYAFKHALVRDAAYDSMLIARRAVIHDALLKHLQADDTTQPQILAHHAAAAGHMSQAADHWERAGERAAARSTFGEAIAHFEQALHCVGALDRANPNGPGDDARERALRLELRLAHASVAGRGHASPLTVQAFKRAHELADSLAASKLRFAAYYGYSVTQLVRSELHEASRVAAKLLHDAERDDDDVQRLMAHCCRGTAATLMGEFDIARQSFEHVVSLGEPMTSNALVRQFGHEPRGVARCYFALALWCQGQADRAADMWQQGMRVALAANHTPSQAAPTFYGALLAGLSRTGPELEERSVGAVEFTEQHGFQMWLGFAKCLRGWAALAHGDVAAALKGVREGRVVLDATGTRFLAPMVSVIEARALAAAGEHDRALALLRDTQRRQDASGERWMAAEVWRVIGDMHQGLPGANRAAAEAAYQCAIDVAREQTARSWELRAATSLAQLWLEHGERQRAGELLGRVCDGFAAPADGADLVDARRVLAAARSR